MEEKVDFQEFLKLAEEKTGLKFKFETGDYFILDDLKVVGIGLVGAPSKIPHPKLNLKEYKEVDLVDFAPEVETIEEKGSASVSYYLVYDYEKPSQVLGVETSKVSFKATWLLSLANLFKRIYGEVHLYIHEHTPMPIIILGKPIGEEYRGLEAYIAPRLPELRSQSKKGS